MSVYVYSVWAKTMDAIELPTLENYSNGVYIKWQAQ